VWEEAATALLSGENLLLVGPKATGKNVLAENLAACSAARSWDISFYLNTDAASLIGTDTFKNGGCRCAAAPYISARKAAASAFWTR
jgi:nitric oxide reductase NorQ protein